MLEDRESVLAGKRREEQAELDRLEALRNPPTERTKLEILEAIWARQTHPAAAAAAAARDGSYRDLPGLLTVTEVDSSTELDNISGSGGGGSSSSGMGIMGRDSGGGGGGGISGCSDDDDDSLLGGWPGSGEEEADGGGGWIGGRSVGLRPNGGSWEADASVSLMGQSAIGLGGNVRLAEEEEEEEGEEGEDEHWRGVLDEAEGVPHGQGAAAYVSKLGRVTAKGAGGVRGQANGGGHFPPTVSASAGSDRAAPAWGDVSAIEEQGAASLPPTTVTAEAAAVLAAAEQSFSTDDSSQDESAASARTPGAARSGINSEFPVRMLVFPEDDTGAQGGGGASSGGGLDAAEEARVGNGTEEAAALPAVSDDGEESGVLILPRNEVGASRAEDGLGEEGEESQVEAIGRGVVSFDGDEDHGSESGDESEGLVRESAVLGMVRAVREEENAGAAGGARAAGAAAEVAAEDGTLASLDGNEGSPGDTDGVIDAAEVGAAGSQG
ncbi:unnamed protein product, partial [Hapterophycus canaliculatus]